MPHFSRPNRYLFDRSVAIGQFERGDVRDEVSEGEIDIAPVVATADTNGTAAAKNRATTSAKDAEPRLVGRLSPVEVDLPRSLGSSEVSR